MRPRSHFTSNSADAALALALATLAVLSGCGGGEKMDLSFDILGAQSCISSCKVNRVDVYLLKQANNTGPWCLLTSKSFAPSGSQTITGLDLQPHTTFRIALRGFCGDTCYCGHDDTYPIDPQAGSVELNLKRVSSYDCRTPGHDGDCP
jgi:hypothetical protein